MAYTRPCPRSWKKRVRSGIAFWRTTGSCCPPSCSSWTLWSSVTLSSRYCMAAAQPWWAGVCWERQPCWGSACVSSSLAGDPRAWAPSSFRFLLNEPFFGFETCSWSHRALLESHWISWDEWNRLIDFWKFQWRTNERFYFLYKKSVILFCLSTYPSKISSQAGSLNRYF